ncbi:hypothetical protein N9428_01585 [Flavobacteriaceae bacterium]|nr:hypothetical protein [Flavobacteriaceae bacterium]
MRKLFFLGLSFLFTVITLFSCSNDDSECNAILITNTASEITSTTAVLNGNISIPECDVSNFIEQGFVYSRSIQPTVNDIQVNVNGNIISTTIQGLIPETTYFFRSFAINETGVYYGNEISFETNEGARIGDVMEGGVVFWVNPENTSHGLVVAFEDIVGPETQGKAYWGCYGKNIPGAQGSEIGTGLQNTLDVNAAGCGSAASLCSQLDPQNDWFLPSIGELGEIFNNYESLYAVQGFQPLIGGWYWSSTEKNSFDAWRMSGNFGGQNYISKSFLCSVRAVRSF